MSQLSEINRYQQALEVVERRGGSPRLGAASALLVFESGIENAYLTERAAIMLPMQRLALLLSVGFYCSFFGIDALVWKQFQFSWAIIPIVLLSGGLNSLIFLASFNKRFKPYLLRACTVAVIIHAVSFAWVSAHAQTLGLSIPPEAPVIQQLYNFLLLGLPFRTSAPVMLATVGSFIGLHVMTAMPQVDLFYRCFMMSTAGVVGLVASYWLERNQRLAWLRSQLLRELSEHDSLTGLYNHRIFYERGAQLLRQARRDNSMVAVLVADVDHFKKFNDSHGHLAGDEALRHAGEPLSRSARRPLDVAARLGGEEFGLLLYGVTPASAIKRAEELRNAVRGLTLSEGRRVTISVGYALAHADDPMSIEALVGLADAALYRAKTGGRDRVSD